jgi:hypothetical protein
MKNNKGDMRLQFEKTHFFSPGGANIKKTAEKNFKYKYLHYFDALRDPRGV